MGDDDDYYLDDLYRDADYYSETSAIHHEAIMDDVRRYSRYYDYYGPYRRYRRRSLLEALARALARLLSRRRRGWD